MNASPLGAAYLLLRRKWQARSRSGVATWAFSRLKFQADIGIMLTFMFLVNMLAAIILLPALAVWLIHPQGLNSATRSPGVTPSLG